MQTRSIIIVSEEIADLKRRQKRRKALVAPAILACFLTFGANSFVCRGGSALSARRVGDHYVDDVKGRIVSISVSHYEAALPLEIVGLLLLAACGGLAVTDFLLIRTIQASEGELLELQDELGDT